MTHAAALNRDLRAAGVVWHACTGSAREWPFPKGFHETREWLCHVCVSAQLARIYRAAAEYTHSGDSACAALVERLATGSL